jgi:hypothetical protein
MLAVELCMNKDLQILDCRTRKQSIAALTSSKFGDQAGPCPGIHTKFSWQAINNKLFLV